MELLKIDSQTKNTSGVNLAQEYLYSLFSDLGLVSETYKHKESGRFYVYRSSELRTNNPTVLLSGHVDTVLPARDVTIRGDKLLGSGACDMKAGIMTIYEALSDLRGEGKLANVIVAISPEEEVGTPNYATLLKKLSKEAEYALVFEANKSRGGLTLLDSRKGAILYEIHIEGPGGHSGEIVNKEDRVSVNFAIAEIIKKIERLADYSLGTTLNIGTIQSGSAVNVLADNAKLTGEARYLTYPEQSRLKNGLTQIVKETRNNHKLESQIKYKAEFPIFVKNRSNKLNSFARASANRLGQDLNFTVGYGSSEANILSEGNHNLQILDGLGPFGEGEHTEKEFVSISSYEMSIKFTKMLLDKLWS
ncbi:MAG: M20/M25/M40 family metallo-hydrolase [Candidatus Dojkabacteria bacterium]